MPSRSGKLSLSFFLLALTSCLAQDPTQCPSGQFYCPSSTSCVSSSESCGRIRRSPSLCGPGEEYCVETESCEETCVQPEQGDCPPGFAFCSSLDDCISIEDDCEAEDETHFREKDASRDGFRCRQGTVYCFETGTCLESPAECSSRISAAQARPTPKPFFCKMGDILCLESNTCVPAYTACPLRSTTATSRRNESDASNVAGTTGNRRSTEKRPGTSPVENGAISCPFGQAFCLETNECISASAACNLKAREEEPKATTCPIGNVYCIEERSCVSISHGCRDSSGQWPKWSMPAGTTEEPLPQETRPTLEVRRIVGEFYPHLTGNQGIAIIFANNSDQGIWEFSTDHGIYWDPVYLSASQRSETSLQGILEEIICETPIQKLHITWQEATLLRRSCTGPAPLLASGSVKSFPQWLNSVPSFTTDVLLLPPDGLLRFNAPSGLRLQNLISGVILFSSWDTRQGNSGDIMPIDIPTLNQGVGAEFTVSFPRMTDCSGQIPLGEPMVLDQCGVCGGDGSTCRDCKGEKNGTASIQCGFCVGHNDRLPDSFRDCAFQCLGDSVIPKNILMQTGSGAVCIPNQNSKSSTMKACQDDQFSCIKQSKTHEALCEGVLIPSTVDVSLESLTLNYIFSEEDKEAIVGEDPARIPWICHFQHPEEMWVASPIDPSQISVDEDFTLTITFPPYSLPAGSGPGSLYCEIRNGSNTTKSSHHLFTGDFALVNSIASVPHEITPAAFTRNLSNTDQAVTVTLSESAVQSFTPETLCIFSRSDVKRKWKTSPQVLNLTTIECPLPSNLCGAFNLTISLSGFEDVHCSNREVVITCPKPEVRSARFSSTGMEIILEFSENIESTQNQLSQTCEQYFTNSDLTSSRSRCWLMGNQLIITPDANSSFAITPSTELSLRPNAIKVRSTSKSRMSDTFQPNVARTITMSSSEQPVPLFNLYGSKYICTENTFSYEIADLVPGCPGNLRFQWLVQVENLSSYDSDTQTKIQAEVTSLNDDLSEQREKMVLEANRLNTTLSFVLKVTIQVTVTNAAGVQSTVQQNLSVVTDGIYATIVGPEIVFPKRQYVYSVLPLVCGKTKNETQKTYRYSWSLPSAPRNIQFLHRPIVTISSSSLQSGQSYNLNVILTTDDSYEEYFQAWTSIFVSSLPGLTTSSEMIQQNKFPVQTETVIRADGVDSARQSVTWSCMTKEATACWSKGERVEVVLGLERVTQTALVIPPNTLSAGNYLFTANVMDDTKWDTQHFQVNFVSECLLDVNVDIQELRINQGEETVISGKITGPPGVQVEWGMEDAEGFDFINGFQGRMLQLPVKTTSWSFNLPLNTGDGFQPDGLYILRLTAKYSTQEIHSDVTVEVNAPPRGGSLETISNGRSENGTVIIQFRTPTAWWDDLEDYPLIYYFGYCYQQICNTSTTWKAQIVSRNPAANISFFPSRERILPLMKVCDAARACTQVEGQLIDMRGATPPVFRREQLHNFATEALQMSQTDPTKAMQECREMLQALSYLQGRNLTESKVNGTLFDEAAQFSQSLLSATLWSEMYDIHSVSHGAEVLQGANEIFNNVANNRDPDAIAAAESFLQEILNLLGSNDVSPVAGPDSGRKKRETRFEPTSILKFSLRGIQFNQENRRQKRQTSSTSNDQSSLNLKVPITVSDANILSATSQLLLDPAVISADNIKKVMQEERIYMGGVCLGLSADQPSVLVDGNKQNITFQLEKASLMMDRNSSSTFNRTYADTFLPGASVQVQLPNILSRLYASWNCLHNDSSQLCNGLCLGVIVFKADWHRMLTSDNHIADWRRKTSIYEISLLNPKSGSSMTETFPFNQTGPYNVTTTVPKPKSLDCIQCMAWNGTSWTNDSTLILTYWNEGNLTVCALSIFAPTAVYDMCATQTAQNGSAFGADKQATAEPSKIKNATVLSTTLKPSVQSTTQMKTTLPLNTTLTPQTTQTTPAPRTTTEGAGVALTEALVQRLTAKFIAPAASMYNLTGGGKPELVEALRKHIENQLIKKLSALARKGIYLKITAGSINFEVVLDGGADAAYKQLEDLVASGTLSFLGLDNSTVIQIPPQALDGSGTLESKNTTIPMIVAGVIGGTVLLVLLFVLVAMIIKHKKRVDKVGPSFYGGNIDRGLPPSYRSFHFEHSLEGDNATPGRKTLLRKTPSPRFPITMTEEELYVVKKIEDQINQYKSWTPAHSFAPPPPSYAPPPPSYRDHDDE